MLRNQLEESNSATSIEFGPFRFDFTERLLWKGRERVPLTPRATAVLSVLIEARGRIVSKAELLDRAWADASVEEGNLTFQIHQIKKALKDGDGHQYIETLPKRGYRFAAPAPSVLPQPTPTGTRRVGLLVFVVLVCVAAVTVGWWRSRVVRPRIVGYTQLTHDGLAKGDNDLLLSVGAHVYFTEGVSHQLVSVAASGGETRPVSRDASGLQVLDVNMVRSEYLAKRSVSGPAGELWTSSMLGGQPRRTGDILCENATFSPDGAWIACARDDVLTLVSSDARTVQQLARLPGSVGTPRWSPDGTVLRFDVSTRPNGEAARSIWQIRSDGRDLHPLLMRSADATTPDECCGRWTPDGRYYVFQSRHRRQVDLWILREGAGFSATPAPVRLTAGPLSFLSPSPSSDGTKLFALGVPVDGELVRYDRSLHEFVPFLNGMSATWVSFSRDGESVAYVSYPDGTLWTSRKNGTDRRQLTGQTIDVDGSSCSPDGRWIAFRAKTSDRRRGIFIMSIAGGEAKPLAVGDAEQGIPSWSPDGRRLTFGDVPERFGIPTGSERIRIYDLASQSLSVLPNSDGLWTSRWSPDGRYIAALTIAGQRLTLFDVVTRQWRSTAADHVGNPSWSRDGRYVYYDTEGSTRALRRVSIPEGHVEEVTSMDKSPLAVYWWAGLAPDDSPIVLRTAGSPEIYALQLER